jgi:hypothetical protein
MPRKAGEPSTAGNSSNPFSMLKEELGFGPEKRSGNGYEVESVCTHCLGMLQGEQKSSLVEHADLLVPAQERPGHVADVI